jgi:chromosome partitioning protein
MRASASQTMTHIYALANQKGGVGKTTTALNLGAYLAAGGRRVLIVDTDSQANATTSLGIDRTSLNGSLYDALIRGQPLAELILTTSQPRLWLAPATAALAGAEVELVSLAHREHRLIRALAPVSPDYDVVLIDCPPSLGLLTVNGLTAAADGVLIPVQCEYLALEGLGHLLRTIKLVRESLNPNLRIAGLVLTMYDSRTNIARQVVDEVRRYFPGHVFRSIVPRSVRLAEAPSYGETILTYAPHSAGAVAYAALAQELVAKAAKPAP